MKSTKTFEFLAVAGLILAFSATASGELITQDPTTQELTTLRGTVFDRNGSAITRAKVSLSRANERTLDVITNSEGKYEAHVQPGFYSIEITAAGFTPLNLNCYQVPPVALINLDITLTVSGEPTCAPCRQQAKNDSKIIITEQ